MTATLDMDYEDTTEFTQDCSVKNLVFDNWLDSGYRLVLPEVECWSDDY